MGHSLNPAVQDTCRSVKVMADTFDTVLELAKVFKYSAKKKSTLLKLKQTFHLKVWELGHYVLLAGQYEQSQ